MVWEISVGALRAAAQLLEGIVWNFTDFKDSQAQRWKASGRAGHSSGVHRAQQEPDTAGMENKGGGRGLGLVWEEGEPAKGQCLGSCWAR